MRMKRVRNCNTATILDPLANTWVPPSSSASVPFCASVPLCLHASFASVPLHLVPPCHLRLVPLCHHSSCASVPSFVLCLCAIIRLVPLCHHSSCASMPLHHLPLSLFVYILVHAKCRTNKTSRILCQP